MIPSFSPNLDAPSGGGNERSAAGGCTAIIPAGHIRRVEEQGGSKSRHRSACRVPALPSETPSVSLDLLVGEPRVVRPDLLRGHPDGEIRLLVVPLADVERDLDDVRRPVRRDPELRLLLLLGHDQSQAFVAGCPFRVTVALEATVRAGIWPSRRTLHPEAAGGARSDSSARIESS